jgi:RNA polymerase sigma-70 factor (ECF subfamily)
MRSPLPSVAIPAVLGSVEVEARDAPALDIAALYRSHGAAVARWAARLAGPGLEPEDVVQEVFMIAQRKLAGFRGEASPARWLFRITERVVWHRRKQQRKERSRWRQLLGSGTAGETGVATTPDPLELAEQRQAALLVYRALDRLGENHRAAFILFELDGLSGAEIAALKDVAVGTVWVWLHRARAHFLEELGRLQGEGAR